MWLCVDLHSLTFDQWVSVCIQSDTLVKEQNCGPAVVQLFWVLACDCDGLPEHQWDQISWMNVLLCDWNSDTSPDLSMDQHRLDLLPWQTSTSCLVTQQKNTICKMRHVRCFLYLNTDFPTSSQNTWSCWSCTVHPLKCSLKCPLEHVVVHHWPSSFAINNGKTSHVWHSFKAVY